MGRNGSLLPYINYRKAAARERQQLARSGLSTLAAAYPKAIIQVIIQEFMGHQLVDTE